MLEEQENAEHVSGKLPCVVKRWKVFACNHVNIKEKKHNVGMQQDIDESVNLRRV